MLVLVLKLKGTFLRGGRAELYQTGGECSQTISSRKFRKVAPFLRKGRRHMARFRKVVKIMLFCTIKSNMEHETEKDRRII